MSRKRKPTYSELDEQLVGRKGGKRPVESDADTGVPGGGYTDDPDEKEPGAPGSDADKVEDEEEAKRQPRGKDGSKKHEGAESEDLEEDEHETGEEDPDEDEDMGKSLIDRIESDPDLVPAFEVSDVLKSFGQHMSDALVEGFSFLAGRIDRVQDEVDAVKKSFASAVPAEAATIEGIDLSKSISDALDTKLDGVVTDLHQAVDLVKSMAGELVEMGANPRQPKTDVGRILQKGGDGEQGLSHREKGEVIVQAIRKGLCDAGLATTLDVNPERITDDFVKSLRERLRAA